MELQDYQQRVPAHTVQPGDFLDVVEGASVRGPRGGRYRYDGVRVESRVERVCWVYGQEEVDCKPGDVWAPARATGFRIYTRRGRTLLPGNMATLTTAVVRRSTVVAA